MGEQVRQPGFRPLLGDGKLGRVDLPTGAQDWDLRHRANLGPVVGRVGPRRPLRRPAAPNGRGRIDYPGSTIVVTTLAVRRVRRRTSCEPVSCLVEPGDDPVQAPVAAFWLAFQARFCSW
jgi:hypothetical protein